MTPHRRTARACTLGAGLAATITVYLATAGHPWLAFTAAYATLLLTWCARQYHAGHHRILAEHEWARRRVVDPTIRPLSPCCLLAAHSGGAAHDDRCTDTFRRIVAHAWKDRQ
ncbi:hypothetical protein AB0H51_11525 [Streptomyces griseoluteus]|uniref:hypothetical protein n=1 Tax=Streptomyces griseoluteus TaxID=29306 RepID=UPI0033D832CC